MIYLKFFGGLIISLLLFVGGYVVVDNSPMMFAWVGYFLGWVMGTTASFAIQTLHKET